MTGWRRGDCLQTAMEVRMGGQPLYGPPYSTVAASVGHYPHERLSTTLHVHTYSRRHSQSTSLPPSLPTYLPPSLPHLDTGPLPETAEGWPQARCPKRLRVGRCTRYNRRYNWADVTQEIYGVASCDDFLNGSIVFANLSVAPSSLPLPSSLPYALPCSPAPLLPLPSSLP